VACRSEFVTTNAASGVGERLMVGAVVPSRCLMKLYEAPSANIKISLERNT
jgi:hypothetical protein